MIENEITTRATALFGVVDGIYKMLTDWGMSPVLAS
jgi:hypothetical protein